MNNQNEDFYYDQNGNIVFTETFLLKRGFCCGNGCLHCPYGEDIQRAASGKQKEMRSCKDVS
jgi:hypothetical protein